MHTPIPLVNGLKSSQKGMAIARSNCSVAGLIQKADTNSAEPRNKVQSKNTGRKSINKVSAFSTFFESFASISDFFSFYFFYFGEKLQIFYEHFPDFQLSAFFNFPIFHFFHFLHWSIFE